MPMKAAAQEYKCSLAKVSVLAGSQIAQVGLLSFCLNTSTESISYFLLGLEDHPIHILFVVTARIPGRESQTFYTWTQS